jgi:hypothetical protein
VSSVCIGRAWARAAELGVADRVHFVHGDASGFVADDPVEIAACLGATWIGGGVLGTIDLLRRSLADGGVLVIGEPYWVQVPTSDDVARACHAHDTAEWADAH